VQTREVQRDRSSPKIARWPLVAAPPRIDRCVESDAPRRLPGARAGLQALFPFPDGPSLAAEAGATAIAQLGAVRDDEVIAPPTSSVWRWSYRRPPLPPLGAHRTRHLAIILCDESSCRRQRRPRAFAVLAPQSEPHRGASIALAVVPASPGSQGSISRPPFR
jgi:hypothetical protein